MLKYHFITSIRFFIRNRAFSLLSFVGLLFGFTFALALLAYINFQNSYDSFHQNGKEVFRIQLGQETMAAKLFPALAPAIEEQFSGCTTVRLKPATGSIGGDMIPFREEKIYWADRSFFNVLTYPLKYDDPQEALGKPNAVVITPELSLRLFGSIDDHRGKEIIFSDLYNQETAFTVTGILEPVPENSHLTFDALLSFETLPEGKPGYQYGWSWRGIYSYVRLSQESRREEIEHWYTSVIQQLKDIPYNSVNPSELLYLIPIRDVHFLKLPNDAEQYGSVEVVYSVAAFAIIVFVISLFNYLNIGSVSVVTRHKEIGVRKIVGAKTFHLVSQFLTESLAIFSAALVFAFLIFFLAYPAVDSLIPLQKPELLIIDPAIAILIVIFVFLGALVSAFYLTFLLHRLSPSSILKNGGFASSRGSQVKFFMGFQFVVTLFLVICAYAVHAQIRFMALRKLGIDVENVLVIKPVRNADGKSGAVADLLRNQVGISALTVTSQVPGKRFNASLWVYDVKTGNMSPKKEWNSI